MSASPSVAPKPGMPGRPIGTPPCLMMSNRYSSVRPLTTQSSPAQSGPMTLNRRKFLAAAGAGVAGGSLLTMLEARQAPAQIKGTTLRILQWSHFIPAYDNWFDNKLAKEWGEQNGVKVRVDHIPHLELPARMAAEFAAGAGHDTIL